MIGPYDSRNFFCPGPFGFIQSSFQASEQNSVGRFDLSVVWGCSTNANTCFIPNSVHNLPSCWPTNWVPLSDTNLFGIPKRHTMFLHTKCWTLWVVICATGSASIHFVKYSVANTRYFICLISKRKGPRISIPHVRNGHGLYIDLNSSGGALCQSACCWHCFHRWAYLVKSSLMVGQ